VFAGCKTRGRRKGQSATIQELGRKKRAPYLKKKKGQRTASKRTKTTRIQGGGLKRATALGPGTLPRPSSGHATGSKEGHPTRENSRVTEEKLIGWKNGQERPRTSKGGALRRTVTARTRGWPIRSIRAEKKVERIRKKKRKNKCGKDFVKLTGGVRFETRDKGENSG